MCGRYSEAKLEAQLRKRFRIAKELGGVLPRYNMAPGQDGLVVLSTASGAERTLARFRWGLVPSWADDPAVGNKMINARAETLAKKPAFEEAFRKRRCLVPADGFYEWRKTREGRFPVRYVVKGEELFAFAGLWDVFAPKGGAPLYTYTIVTTGPNELVQGVHDRMPALLREEDEDLWLDPSMDDPARLARVLAPFPANRMRAYDVSPRLNSPENDGPECVEPAEPREPAQLSLF
jgi:putative SOS response-associated peptidase YedK